MTTKEFYTERLHLRPITLADSEDMFEYASDAETVQYLTFRRHQDIEETKQTIASFFTTKENSFGIEHIEDEKFIGTIDLNVDKAGSRATFGYVINKKYWGNGYVTEALMCLFDYAFLFLEVKEIYGVHAEHNLASGRVMEKVGMQIVGLQEQSVYHPTGLDDVIIYNITRDQFLEWKTLLEENNTLNRLRYEIDAIDKQLLILLNKRFDKTYAVGEYKKSHDIPLLNIAREEAILTKLSDVLENKPNKPHILKLWQEMMDISKKQQEIKNFSK